jgi:predicted small secreted protein
VQIDAHRTRELKMSKILAAALLAALALSACNTMKGAGKDVSAAGDTVTDQAAKTQNQM